MKRKVIITCAINGDAPLNARYTAELAFPITPAQVAAAAVEAARAGAAIVHIHARDPQTGDGSRDSALYREIVDRVRSSGSDLVINLTCGHGAIFFPDPEREGHMLPDSDVVGTGDRFRHIEQCLPEICSLDLTTANQVDGDRDYIYFNPAPTLRRMAQRFRELGVKPELETFQAGDVLFGNQLVEDGLVEGVPLYQFVLGVKWGAPATPETMMYMRGLLPPGASWTAFGISRMQMPMAAQAILLGGNVRVGLEDNLYLDRGKFATNSQLIERAVGLVTALGEEVATPQDARRLLGLKTPTR